MKKLTFKQYLESKEQLLQAINNPPISTIEYEVRKYCTIPIGETESDKQLIGLKPKQKIIVEWKYDSITNPQPISISFFGLKDITESEQFSTSWTGSKLRNWLARHVKPGINQSFKI
ncbi:MAG: hypothetical protein ACXW2E_01975 [Nitrososphaeraceae archaeon]